MIPKRWDFVRPMGFLKLRPMGSEIYLLIPKLTDFLKLKPKGLKKYWLIRRPRGLRK